MTFHSVGDAASAAPRRAGRNPCVRSACTVRARRPRTRSPTRTRSRAAVRSLLTRPTRRPATAGRRASGPGHGRARHRLSALVDNRAGETRERDDPQGHVDAGAFFTARDADRRGRRRVGRAGIEDRRVRRQDAPVAGPPAAPAPTRPSRAPDAFAHCTSASVTAVTTVLTGPPRRADPAQAAEAPTRGTRSARGRRRDTRPDRR